MHDVEEQEDDDINEDEDEEAWNPRDDADEARDDDRGSPQPSNMNFDPSLPGEHSVSHGTV